MQAYFSGEIFPWEYAFLKKGGVTMKQLSLYSEIYVFDTFREFAEEFKISSEDLIFTRKAFLPYFEVLKEKPHFLFNDDFGKGEPTDRVIDKMLAAVKEINYKRVVAIGGGSVVDIAKLFALKSAENAKQLFLREVPIIKEKELVIIPTTCGTGSEVSNISIASIESMNTKFGLADKALFADQAVLIPELLKDLPFKVIVNSSVDALVHASESYLSPKATHFTETFSKEAVRDIIGTYKKAAANGNKFSLEDIKTLLIASTYAGIAFGHAGTAVVHAMAYPLGAVYHVPHGEANHQFFVSCFKYYAEKKPDGKIENIAQILSEIIGCKKENAFEEMGNIIESLLPLKKLKEYGMKEEECASFAESVIKNQQRLLVNSYITVPQEDIEKIYKERF